MAGPIVGTKIDLIESSGADLPPPGTTRIIRKGGATQQSVDGGAWSAIAGASSSPGSLQASLEAQLTTLTGVSMQSLCFDPMGAANGSTWSATGTGTGPATQDTVGDADVTWAALSAGGFFVQGTGTGVSGALGANNAIIQTPNFAGRSPVLKYNDASRKFGMAWVGNILSTPDANSVLILGTTGGSGTFGNWQMGVVGSISTTKFVLTIGTALGASIVSTVSIDANRHTLKSWNDGTNVWFQVDNEAPQSLPAIPLFPLNGSTGKSVPILLSDKVGGAVNHLMGTVIGLWMCATS